MSDPGQEPPEPRPSGLRNPGAAVRGVGAGALAAEGFVLLLAIVPVTVLGGALGGASIAVIVVLSVLGFVLAGTLRRSWGWIAGTVLQVLVIAAGFATHAAVGAIGVVFGLVWLYVLYVRQTVLSGHRR